MRKKRFAEHQIIKVLKQVESGRQIQDVCRECAVSQGNLLQLEIKIRWNGSI